MDFDCFGSVIYTPFLSLSEDLFRRSKELALNIPLTAVLLLTKMHRLLALLLVAILATVALAAPTAKQTSTHSLKKRSFTIPRIRKTGYIRKPSEAMGRAYRKFGWSMTTPDGSPWVAVSKTPTTMNLHADVSSPSNVTSTPDTTSSDQSPAANDRHFTNLKDWLYASFSWSYAPPAASSAVAAPSAQTSYAAAPSAAASSAAASSTAVAYTTYTTAAASYAAASSAVTSAAAAATTAPAPANASPAPGGYAAPAPAADGDDETGEVVATPADNGAEYLSPVTIGGQKLNLNFDTGSSDLYV